MSTAYVLGTRMTQVFARRGLCVGLHANVSAETWDFTRWEGDGRIEDLPRMPADSSHPHPIGPTELPITSRRAWELSQCGLLALCHNSHSTAFLSTPTCQQPKRYEVADASANAAIAADFACVLVVSRFSHYVQAIHLAEKGEILDQKCLQDYLNRWICQYMPPTVAPSSPRLTNAHPLVTAHIEFRDDPGQPGNKVAIMYLRPWLDHGGLTTEWWRPANKARRALNTEEPRRSRDS